MPARWLGIREGVRPHAVMARERLYERLDRSRSARLLWVVGEDGLGKSTLLASYVARRGRACLWLDLTPGDADPGMLFSHLATSVRSAAVPASMSPQHTQNVLGFARRFFIQLLARLPVDTLIVLDSCEHVAGSAIFPLILREALAVTPDGMQWCLLNGEPACEDLAYLVTLFEGDRLGPGELLLNEEDVTGLLPPALRAQEGLAARLTQASAGSIGALRLLLAAQGTHANHAGAPAARNGGHSGPADAGLQIPAGAARYWSTDAMPFEETGANRSVSADAQPFASAGAGSADPDVPGGAVPAEAGAGFVACAQVFLSRLPESARDALIALALPDRITADMLDSLVRDTSMKRMILGWIRRDLVLQVTAQGWRMHPPLRAVVLEMSQAQWNGGRRGDLRYALARHCERHGHIHEAIRLYGEAGEWGAAAGLVQREAEAEIEAGRWARVRQWIEGLPDDTIERVPQLRYWLGRALAPLDAELGRLCFRRAQLQFERIGDTAGQALSLAGMLELSLARSSNEAQIPEWVSALDSLLDRVTRFPSRVLESNVLCALVKGALWSATAPGGLAARTRRLHELLGAVELGADARLRAAACLLEFYAVGGHPDLANRLRLQADSGDFAGDASAVVRASWRWACGLQRMLAGDASDGVCAELDAAVELAHDERLHDLAMHARLCLAMLRTGQHRFSAAQEDLSALRSAARTRVPADAAGVAILTAALARGHGNPDEALRQAQEFMRTGAVALPRYLLLLWGVVAVEIEIAHGTTAGALSALAQLDKRAQHFCHAPWQLAAAVLHADRLSRQGDALGGRQAVAQALRLHRDNPTWAMVLRPMQTTAARVLEWCLAQGIEPAQAEALIGDLDLQAPARSAADWPWCARLRVLGTVEAVGAAPLRALLGELVAAESEGVSERELQRSLYPEEHGVKARTLLARAIARLQSLLGEPRTVRREGGRWSLSTGHCWVDAWAFLDLVREEPARALALYRGPLLPGVEGPRVTAFRQYLHVRYIDAVVAYGQDFELQSSHAAALALYQAALEIDGGCEVFYQGVMRCELHLGRVEQARRAYDLLTRTLEARGGERPSSVTEALRERVEGRARAESKPDAEPGPASGGV